MNDINIKRIIRESINNLLVEGTYEDALQYVRDNRTWSDADDRVTIKRMGMYRRPLYSVSPTISNEIVKLMDEYGEENGLGEDWWDGDTDKIFNEL